MHMLVFLLVISEIATLQAYTELPVERSNLVLVDLCKIGKFRQSRNLLDMFTAHDNACWWVSWCLCTKLVKDVEQTRYPVCDVSVYRAKIALINAGDAGISLLVIERNKGKWTLFYSCFGNCRVLACKILSREVCMIWRKLIAACKIHRKSSSRRPDGLSTLD